MYVLKQEEADKLNLALTYRENEIVLVNSKGIITYDDRPALTRDEVYCFGIDTETVSDTGALLSLQIWDETGEEAIIVYGTNKEITVLKDLMEFIEDGLNRTGKSKAFGTAHNLQFEINGIFREWLDGSGGITSIENKKEGKYTVNASLKTPFFIKAKFRNRRTPESQGGTSNRKDRER